MSEAVDPALLEIMACPESRARVVQRGAWLYSTDAHTRRRYPIRDGIPIMLIDESEVVGEEEFRRVMAETRAPSSGKA